ncbi:MAG: hypothetical protein U0354_21175 [Candidatus Sericytochromatia bacterium]
MKIKLTFENKFYAILNLNNDFKCVGKTITDVENQIIGDFKTVFDTMLPIHSAEYHYDIIEINFIEYHTKENEDILGYFSHEKTIKNNAYNFGLYYDTCKEYLINKCQVKKITIKNTLGFGNMKLFTCLILNSSPTFVRTEIN